MNLTILAQPQAGNEVYRDDLAIVFENDNAFPRAWIVHEVQDNRSGGGISLLATGRVDGRQVAYINGPMPRLEAPPDGGRGERVVVDQENPETIRINVTATADGLLVVSEPYASGWNAYLDGERVEILRTNHALRGVPVPAGDHTVVMRYEPRSLTIGLWTTGFTSIAMIGIWAWALVDWRRRGDDDLASAKVAPRAASSVTTPRPRPSGSGSQDRRGRFVNKLGRRR